MSRILKVTANPRSGRVNVLTEDGRELVFTVDTVARNGIKTGLELTPERIEQLEADDLVQACVNSVMHYLSYRPRSEVEVVQQLRRKRYGDETIEKAVARLREQGLVNDAAFAEFWRDNRQTFKPRSRWMIKAELGRKGVTDEVAQSLTEEVDDEAAAYDAGLKKARSLRSLPYLEFRARLGGFLKRRGFNYDIIKKTVRRLWEEPST